MEIPIGMNWYLLICNQFYFSQVEQGWEHLEQDMNTDNVNQYTVQWTNNPGDYEYQGTMAAKSN